MLAAMRRFATAAVPVVAGYLLGSIPTADLVGRRVAPDTDLRTVGDRNPGFWNARAQLGARAARPVLVGDVGKGIVATLIGRVVARPGQWWVSYLAAGAAMVGHAWPLLARFRGGRAVATFGGAAGVLSPPTTAIALGAGAATYAARRSGADAVRVGFVAYPLAQLVVDGPRRTAATGALMTFIGLRFAMARSVRPAPPGPPPSPPAAGKSEHGGPVGQR